MKIGRPESKPVRTVLSNDIALCCIGRRENRYAREFVAHYQRIGFDKIFICDNNCSGEERFEEVVGDYIEKGFVQVLNYRDMPGIQCKAYSDVYKKYGKQFKWIAFFDFDESRIVFLLDYIAIMVFVANVGFYIQSGLLRIQNKKEGR